MSYPTTVDTGQVAPLALYLDDPAAGAAAAGVAGAAFFNGISLNACITLTQMRTFLSGTPTGMIDMGIYDASGANSGPGNLLGHTGPISASTGVFTQNLTASLPLAPGQYWLALLDTVADSILVRSSNAGVFTVMRTSATNLTVLPAVAGAVSDNLNRFFIMGLRQGGYV